MSRRADLVGVNLAFIGASVTLATAIPGYFLAALVVSAVLIIGSDLWEMTK